jgi:Uma2 family endonuclease
MSVAPQLMTTEELEAIPDDGRERWLIDGALREGGMTRRNRGHSRIESKISQLLLNWSDIQPAPRGEVLSGEAGLRLSRNPDTTVVVDVAYISVETAKANANDDGLVNGAPVLAVEILSPSDKHEEVKEKIESYLRHGTKLVWIVDPAFQTITVYRPESLPQMCNIVQHIDAEPHLPGFKVAVSEIFSR